jgi:hypothetical protein
MMMYEAELKSAFLDKERAVTLLSNLTKLESDGSATPDQTKSLREDYSRMIEKASLEIERIKGEAAAKIESLESEKAAAAEDLSNLSLRHKVGEIKIEEFRASESKLRAKIDRLSSGINDLQRAASANSSLDLSGESTRDEGPVFVSSKKSEGKDKQGVVEIIRRSYDIYRDNPSIIVPSLIPIAWSILGLVLLAGIGGFGWMMYRYSYPHHGFMPGYYSSSFHWGFLPGLGLLWIGLLIYFLIAAILTFICGGTTIEMIRQAETGGKADLGAGWRLARAKLGAIFVASIIYALAVALGLALFVIPGLAIAIVLGFFLQAIMIDDRSAVDSLKSSYAFVLANPMEAFIVMMLSVAIYLLPTTFPYIGTLWMIIAQPVLYLLPTVFYLGRRLDA